MKIVRIKFHDWRESGIHRIQNFGEDLWTHFRDETRVEIDLAQIDRCIDEIAFRARPRYVRTAIRAAEAVMRKHVVEGEASITVEERGQP
jgi:hypothetical protein